MRASKATILRTPKRKNFNRLPPQIEVGKRKHIGWMFPAFGWDPAAVNRNSQSMGLFDSGRKPS